MFFLFFFVCVCVSAGGGGNKVGCPIYYNRTITDSFPLNRSKKPGCCQYSHAKIGKEPLSVILQLT